MHSTFQTAPLRLPFPDGAILLPIFHLFLPSGFRGGRVFPEGEEADPLAGLVSETRAAKASYKGSLEAV